MPGYKSGTQRVLEIVLWAAIEVFQRLDSLRPGFITRHLIPIRGNASSGHFDFLFCELGEGRVFS